MSETNGFDRGAAITRSLLGWGVVAGPFYLVVGLALALTRPGFDLTRYPLSLLMLGPGGWMQRTCIILSGIMVLAAAYGFHRAVGRTALTTALAVYGAGLVLSGVFPPDPMAGFPPGAPEGGSISGLLHMALGAVAFVGLAVAAFLAAGWFAGRGDAATARWSRIAGVVVVVGFVGGAALSRSSVGVAALWVAVVAGWAWLLVASLQAYRTVPHPDAHRRAAPT